ncbi:inositol polyphosphate multikinase beta-like [Octopus sinensis]|uniref:Kinase n=1 Tax=Octopus sinensis TaxID=2607531 RepID=A0A6P7TYX7_9MOLL|nr:inositol polyphosphate multikinase beta-like [Octopus sinensis]
MTRKLVVLTISSEFLAYQKDKLLKKLKTDRRGLVESEYYKTVSNPSTDVDRMLCRFSPIYYKTLFDSDSNNCYFCKSLVDYLCLENISATFQNPTLIDIKIGPVTWEPGCVDQYKMNKFPASAQVKFRICGMKVVFFTPV